LATGRQRDGGGAEARRTHGLVEQVEPFFADQAARAEAAGRSKPPWQDWIARAAPPGRPGAPWRGRPRGG
jgi:hypothetical protein